MKAQIVINDHSYTIELNKPYADLSMAVSNVARAWYINAPTFEPVVLGDWKGSVALGGAVNFLTFHSIRMLMEHILKLLDISRRSATA